MIADWSSYDDPLNSVNRPLQMGPLWMQVRQLSGMPIEERIWADDPPPSSYLPCIAVKAAQLQSPRAAELYLRRLREAVMCRGRNVVRREVVLEIASELSADFPGAFDASAFSRDLDGPAALDAFREDLTQARYRNVGRFPTLTLRRPGERQGLMLVGYRPYAALLESVRRVAPGVRPVHPIRCRGAYAALWGDILPREWAELEREEGQPIDAPPAAERTTTASH